MCTELRRACGRGEHTPQLTSASPLRPLMPLHFGCLPSCSSLHSACNGPFFSITLCSQAQKKITTRMQPPMNENRKHTNLQTQPPLWHSAAQPESNITVSQWQYKSRVVMFWKSNTQLTGSSGMRMRLSSWNAIVSAVALIPERNLLNSAFLFSTSNFTCLHLRLRAYKCNRDNARSERSGQQSHTHPSHFLPRTQFD